MAAGLFISEGQLQPQGLLLEREEPTAAVFDVFLLPVCLERQESFID
jgi:hypothetical protein